MNIYSNTKLSLLSPNKPHKNLKLQIVYNKHHLPCVDYSCKENWYLKHIYYCPRWQLYLLMLCTLYTYIFVIYSTLILLTYITCKQHSLNVTVFREKICFFKYWHINFKVATLQVEVDQIYCLLSLCFVIEHCFTNNRITCLIREQWSLTG